MDGVPLTDIESDAQVNMITLTDREDIQKRRRKSRARTKRNKNDKPSRFFTTIDAYQEPKNIGQKKKHFLSRKGSKKRIRNENDAISEI